MKKESDRRKVLAVASGGGHWVQLRRIAPAFDGCETVYVTVHSSYRPDVGGQKFYSITDATRHTPLKLIHAALVLFWIICKERPDAVVSTGAAPGYIAIRLGKLFGARTIWLDSIANVERLSMSGDMAGRHSDLWLTQWPHLAEEDGPHYKGAVL